MLDSSIKDRLPIITLNCLCSDLSMTSALTPFRIILGNSISINSWFRIFVVLLLLLFPEEEDDAFIEEDCAAPPLAPAKLLYC